MPPLGVVPGLDVLLVCCPVTMPTSSLIAFHRRVCLLLGVVVPDGVAGPQSNPLRDRAVLLLRLCELYLRAERLVGLSGPCISMSSHTA